MRRLRILTFARHEPFLCLLAKTGHDFEVYEPWVPALGRVRRWMHEYRPVPANARIVSREEMAEGLAARRYDLVLCHDGVDLAPALSVAAPKVLVFHTRLNRGDEDRPDPVTRAEVGEGYERIVRASPDVHVVFVSESKRESWALRCPARVIPPGIDLEDYGGWTGETPAALRVGSNVLDNLANGGLQLMYVTWGLPLRIVGHNPRHLTHARPSRDWEDLKAQLRTHRVYVNTTDEAYEDGYNLGLLEAMATGMPVVATANRTSPITDGHDGFVSDDLVWLREKLIFLLTHPEEAGRLGANARRTVAERFPLDAFVRSWNEVLAAAVGARRSRTKRSRIAPSVSAGTAEA